MLTPSAGNVAGIKAVKSTNQQLNRACESCRLLKVRCLADDASFSPQCQRCSKAGRQCIFVAPQRKRPRKRTDARVAELEREVRAMRALLKDSRSLRISEGDETDSKDNADNDDCHLGIEAEEDHAIVAHGESTPKAYVNSGLPKPQSCSGLMSATSYSSSTRHADELGGSARPTDVVDRGIISMDTATALVALYVTELVQHFPAVILSEYCTAFELRVKKPVLFLAVIAAASLGGDSEVSHTLYKEIIRLYADRIFIKGEKSLELVQSLLLTVAYCYPPDSAAHLQFYQYSHMAATMALDIGIGSKPRTAEYLATDSLIKDHGSLYDGDSVDDGSLMEKCRALLTCYAVTAGLGLRLRRPNMLLFNNWMGECLRLLEESPAILDRRLAALVTLQRIADEASTSFGFDDPSTTISLSETHTMAIVKSFERHMEEWKRIHSPDIVDVSLTISYYQNFITIYEFAMDGGHHDVELFKKRYFSLPTSDDDKSTPLTHLSAIQVNATMKCIGASQALLNTFLQTETDNMRTFPNAFYVRAIYSIVVLLKISFTISTTGLGQLIDSTSLKIDHYTDQMTQRFADAAGPMRNCRVPNKWLPILKRLKEWHEHHKARATPIESSEPLRSITQSFQGECNFDVTDTIDKHILSTSKFDAGPLSRTPNSTEVRGNTAWEPPHNALLDRTTSQSTVPVLSNSSFLTMADYAGDYRQNDPFLTYDLDEDLSGWIQDSSILNDVDYGDISRELEPNLGNQSD
ncbi:hypothetical protein MMC11_004015 [Xylographa trunciseda]|nr:hypothetical protein [Xylographa trunciseda]